MTGDRLWYVAVPVPLRRAFCYRIPRELGTPVRGGRVAVSFHGRRLTGFLIGPAEPNAAEGLRIKPALALLDAEPALPEELIDFLAAAAAYYLHPIGEVMRTAMPQSLDADRAGTAAEPAGRTIRTHLVARPLPKAEAALETLVRRAPKRAAVLGRIVAEGAVPLAELGRERQGARAVARRLAADGLVALDEVELPADPFFGSPVTPDSPPALNAEQYEAASAILAAIDAAAYKGFLLHGITGSGKTEVYLSAIQHARDLGRGALVLVPEIALTPQLVMRYRARFGDGLAVWHSGLTDRERRDQWQLLRSGRVGVAIGVRSAVFAPVENLGIVVVDEEHDGSFKQERGFHYHARDLALLRASRARAVAVLGSATPSLESHNNANVGKLARLELRFRATAQPLPEVEIVDLRRHRFGPGGQTLVSRPLFDAVSQALERREQAILFLNRRGFAPTLICRACGAIARCDACAVSLTLHSRPRQLLCHYCGKRLPVPARCLACGADDLEAVGAGTQKAEDTLHDLFASARIARLDRDTGVGRKAEAILDRLRRKEVDILVGTQMVTKGHDFPNVTVVGVLLADVGLNLPDFRAAERTFQLLTQVAGRAGRSERGGRALIQTFCPDHPAVSSAQTHDFHGFAKLEAASRAELGYPPFGRLAALRLSGTDADRTESAARDLFAVLAAGRRGVGDPQAALLGPAPAPLGRIQGRFRWRILVRAAKQITLRKLLVPALPAIETPPGGVRITLDIDPVSML